MYDPNNPFTPGTAEHATKDIADKTLERRATEFEASGPMTFTRSLGPLAAWGGIFALSIWGSIGSFKAVGEIVLIGCVALLAIVIAVAAYKYLVPPARKLPGRSWRGNALARTVVVGAGLGIGLGAWIGYSDDELLRGVVRLGVMGTVLGLIVGVLLIIIARASNRGPRER